MKPKNLLLSTLCLTLPALLSGVPSSDQTVSEISPETFEPNKTLREKVFAFGASPESAERAAMIEAWEIAREGVFKVKDVNFGSADGEDYCILLIEHDIYEAPDTKRVGEAVVGFGRDPRSALNKAQAKALERIRKNPRSRPNLRRSTLPTETRDFMPMLPSEERDFIIGSLRFWGRDGEWRCYLDFQYLEMK